METADDVTAEYYRFYELVYSTHPFPAEGTRRLAPHGLVKKAVSIAKKGKALELGSGFGDNCLYLAEHGFTVTAIDFSLTAINKLKRSAQTLGLSECIDTWNANVCHAILPDDNRLIISNYLIDHFDPDRARWLIGRMQEKTAKRGVNVIVTYAHGTDLGLTLDAQLHTDLSNEFGLPKPELASRYFPTKEELLDLYSGWDIVTCEIQKDTLMFSETSRRKNNPVLHLIARKK
jgi:SAM-dependent methyltransferase